MNKIPPIPKLYKQISKNHLQKASIFTDELWYSRLIGRRISIVFTWMFLKLGLTPMTVTYMCIGIALIGLYLLCQPSLSSVIIGFICFQLYIIWDSSDGEMARFLNTRSVEGAFVDKIMHMITKSGIYIPFGVIATSELNDIRWLILSFAICYLSLLASTYYHLLPTNQTTSYTDQVMQSSKIIAYLRKAYRFFTGDIELSYFLLLIAILNKYSVNILTWAVPLILYGQGALLVSYFINQTKALSNSSSSQKTS